MSYRQAASKASFAITVFRTWSTLIPTSRVDLTISFSPLVTAR